MDRRLAAALIAALMILVLATSAMAASTDNAAYFVLGASGAPVKQLQARLAHLGFYDSLVDGEYGGQTEAAVIAFKEYLGLVRDYETMRVGATEEPTAAPTASPAADAKLDAATLSMLYDDSLDLYIGDVTVTSTGADVRRVQRRLKVLNYLNDIADGAMGVNTRAALAKFQRLNGLALTGAVDAATRAALYSDSAVVSDKPIYNQLSQGMTGDEVRALQERLWLLGFTYSSVDGAYGGSTTAGVKNVQRYLHSLEAPAGGFAPLSAEAAFAPSGAADPDLIQMLVDGEFDIYRTTIRAGTENTEEVKRLQRRLYALEYMAGSSAADGDFGEVTIASLKEFQDRNGLPATGIADEQTQLRLYSDDAIVALKPYLVKVSTDDQRVYVYAPDENEEYTVLVKKFICSTGMSATPTPKGVFKYTAPGTNEWHYFSKFRSWAHWPFYIDGDIMFHSVLFNEKDNPKSLQRGTLTKLGKKASHGCIRLKEDDAKWIHQNCPKRTTVIIY